MAKPPIESAPANPARQMEVVSCAGERGAAVSEAGWQRDPTGRFELRYWNGTAWTEHVSSRGEQSTDQPGDVPPPPPQVTPPPAAPPQTVQAPPQPTVIVQKRGRGCLWAAMVLVALIVGVVVIFAVAVDNAVDDLNAEQAEHAITKEQFDAIPLGIMRADLESQLGKPPQDAQEFVSEGVLDEQELRSSCVYYNEVGESFGSRFQFCFDGDSLRSKNAY
jgi:hypothetical protein